MVFKNRDDLISDIEAIPEFVFRSVALDKISGPPPTDGTDMSWVQVPYSTDRCITEAGKYKPLAFTSGRYAMTQFKDAWIPLVDGDCVGQVKYNEGFAILDVFPAGEEYQNPDGSRIGITSYNSVNKTSAMIVKFSVARGDKVFTLPHAVKGFYKAHVGKVAAKAANYISMINDVKAVWSEVITRMSAIEITPDNFEAYTKDFECDPRVIKEFKTAIDAGSKYNLWGLTLAIYDTMQTKYAKSDIHMRKRIDSFVNSIQLWGTLLSMSSNKTGGV